jgi:phosphoglycerate kinase
LINNLAGQADKILIGGAIANTFLAASGQDVSDSLYEREMFETCEDILSRYQDKIVLPVDQARENSDGGRFKIMDIGPETIAKFEAEIATAATTFWNGNLGHSEDERYETGTRRIAEAISKNKGTTIVAGGDTVGFIDANNLRGDINFISTGGGATLSYLAGEKMPGLIALDNNKFVSNIKTSVI